MCVPGPDLDRLRHETQAGWSPLRELPPLRAGLHGIPGLDLLVVDGSPISIRVAGPAWVGTSTLSLASR